MVRILIVEDERPLADAVARGLRREGMAVDVAYDGDSGHEKVSVTRYDVVVLDRDLPGMSGDELCTEIARSAAVTRVLMLTASAEVADRVSGLSLGADDYLAKPFAFDVLAARIDRILARAARIDELKRSNLALDARIAARAIELGEAKAELAVARTDRSRLMASIRGLHDALALQRNAA